MADEGVKSLLRALPPWSGALRGEDVFLLIRARWLDAAGAPRAWAGNASTRAQLRRALNALPERFAKGEPDPVTGELFWSCCTPALTNLAALAQAATAVASAPPRGVWRYGALRAPVFACLAALTPQLTAEQDQDGPHTFPRRAIVEMSATSSVRPVDAALVARLNIRHWMWLVTQGAPARLYTATARNTDQCEDCACGANPVKITGPRREVYMTGRRKRQRGWCWGGP